ncbi:hypothetical protein IHE44_0008458 [Lamprotornis superbus]|uniref:Phosphatidylinositol-4-phosphate 3-kinase n=4 Tax=Passeriformes TaxID=9126 RepID=A0A835NNF7_9PASS|nr:hypothetical protein IHE44_0008458 [Lamprotornis superbus]
MGVAPRPHSLANGYELFEVSEERDEEVAAFCHMLDNSQNSRNSRGFRVPPGSSTVDLLIYQALCYTHDELGAVDVEDFLLKICGLEEFLQNKHALGSHEHIQHCRKFDIDIRLQLLRRKGVRSELARTASDDRSPSTLNHHIHLQERPIKHTISRQALSLLFDTFHNEVDAFLAAEGDFSPKAERVIQSVMAICNALAAVESQEITAALNQMPPCPSRMQPKIQKRIVESLTAAILNLVELYCSTFNADFQTAAPGSRELGAAQEARLLSCPLSFTVYATHRIPITWAASYEDFYLSCSLSHGGKELCSPLLTRKAHVYKYLFHLIIWDQQICFPVQVNRLPRETLLSVTLFAVPVPPPGGSSDTNKQRRVPEALGWVTTPLFNFRQYVGVLTCGRKLLGLWPATQDNSRARSSAPNFNQPDSVILQFTNPPAAESSPRYEFGSLGEEDQRQLREAMQKKSLYWLTDVDRQRLWEKRCHCHASPGALPMLLASAPSWDWGCLPDIYALLSHWSSMSHQDALGLLHATFPDQEVRRTAVQWIDSISDTELLDYLPQLVQVCGSTGMCHRGCPALKYECYLDSPLVRFLMKRAICDLKVTHYFFWLLKDGLKDSQFSIRYQYLLAALLCCCGKGLREEFDRQCLLVSTLARLAQQVRDAAPSARQVGAGVLGGVQGVLGGVQGGILREGLEDVAQFFKAHGSCRLPLSPSLLVKGIVPRLALTAAPPSFPWQDCSYFNSNAVPLKLSFQNVDPLGENIRVIFKVSPAPLGMPKSWHSPLRLPLLWVLRALPASGGSGGSSLALVALRPWWFSAGSGGSSLALCGDDLRQDMLTLQMIRIMNKIWVQEGLDMRMVIFRCFSTGRGRGMVEMIPNAETLRKIQVEHGVTGSFKDRPLADWLQKHNPKEDEYEKAVENFIYSCAGCCVATYVLGICDRHNDNIMLKTTGHMFHIDFGRFLGHAQMFGNIKRDRAPFVFTSDMAYVINGGDKPSSRFHDFVDLCCQAYNLIRKHTHLFLNLLGLVRAGGPPNNPQHGTGVPLSHPCPHPCPPCQMLSCGIPELSDLEDLKYVYDALRPQDSDADATTYFTRLIESSLGSVATKLNFFIHNLAQMKFTGSEARPSLSFAPRTHTLKMSGRIRDVFLCRHERVFNPSKGYVSGDSWGQPQAGFRAPRVPIQRQGPVSLQTYVVKVQRDNPGEVTFVQRTFEEFQELHNKLRLLFPSSLLPSFPSRFVIGRSRGEAVAERRKEELNGYIWHLIHAAPEVAEVGTRAGDCREVGTAPGPPARWGSAWGQHSIGCDLIYTFFHPLPRDEKAAGTNPSPKPAGGEGMILGGDFRGGDIRGVPSLLSPSPDATWARSLGKVGGEVKLSISYKNNKLFIMVMHIRGLPPLQDGNDPDPYVKTYLLPDPQKTTKRKTKVARKTCNPTYNEMVGGTGMDLGCPHGWQWLRGFCHLCVPQLVYDGIPRGDLEQRELRLSVLSEEGFWENILLGEVGIRLRDLDLAQEKMGWFALGSRGHGTL